MEKVREVWYDAYKGFPIGGSCPQSGLMRAKFPTTAHKWAISISSPLIRPCGATFSLRAKSRLRRLRSDTRLWAQPQGGRQERGCQNPAYIPNPLLPNPPLCMI